MAAHAQRIGVGAVKREAGNDIVMRDAGHATRIEMDTKWGDMGNTHARARTHTHTRTHTYTHKIGRAHV